MHPHGRVQCCGLSCCTWHVAAQELADKAVGVAQGRHTFEDVMDELKEHEMEIFFALVDGSALAQHMEVRIECCHPVSPINTQHSALPACSSSV